MSSSEAAAKPAQTKPVRAKPVSAKTGEVRGKHGSPAPQDTPTGLAETATRLADDLQRSLAAGRLDVLPPAAVQALLTAACRLYAAQVEAGQQYLPVANVTSTDLMVTASGLLRAGNLAVFELGMWQSWTGR